MTTNRLSLWRKFMFLGFIASILNFILSFILSNFWSMFGWFVALCWFPYKEVFLATQSKSRGKAKW